VQGKLILDFSLAPRLEGKWTGMASVLPTPGNLKPVSRSHTHVRVHAGAGSSASAAGGDGEHKTGEWRSVEDDGYISLSASSDSDSEIPLPKRRAMSFEGQSDVCTDRMRFDATNVRAVLQSRLLDVLLHRRALQTIFN
jgi:hypothetical protein